MRNVYIILSTHLPLTACSFLVSPTVTLSETELTVTEGEEVRVQCLGEGVGVVRIRWYFDNEESALQSGNNLVIPSVASTHTGLYECRVSNIADTVTKTVQITVRCELHYIIMA